MASSLSFSFKKFQPNEPNLIFQGDALVTLDGRLLLTDYTHGPAEFGSIGRALFASPVHIWDSKTGSLASFKTSFSFIIDAPDPSKAGDGLAFFLAPLDTQPQQGGGHLGIFHDNHNSNHVAAVEFDTFSNHPIGPHIGINVNGTHSEKTIPWTLENGEVAKVEITYEASTKSLTATLVYPLTDTKYSVSYVVDLKDFLPEFVRVGFSAASDTSPRYLESHDVLSWSFESKFA